MDPRRRRGSALRFLWAGLLLPQGLSAAEPSHLQWGRLSVGVEAAASVAPEDRAFFNDTGYRGNPLRSVSLALSGALRLAPAVAILAEARMENLDAPRLYAFYVRARPWASRTFDVQVGLIPPVFGAFGRRSYGSGNALVGHPLGYQYLVTLRTDAVPTSADDLLAVRGGGWLVRYPSQVGTPDPSPGLPLVNGLRWDAGLEARVGSEPWQLAMALTQGTLGSPRVRDDNGGKQLSARLGWKPTPGIALGLSAARGAYLDRELRRALPPEQTLLTFAQRAVGLDFEYSKGHGIARAEAIWSEWDLPAIDVPRTEQPLGALALSLEGQYKLSAGLYLAARADRLSFTQLSGSGVREPWDAPVSRVEVVLGYSLRRGLVLKGGYQHNWRKGGPPGRNGFPLAQALWRF